MPTIYCAFCGKDNIHSLEKPKTCAKCGKPFASAFKIKTESLSDVNISIPRRSVKRYIPKDINPEEFDENDDPDTQEAIKAEIIASLKGGISVSRPVSNSVKIEDLFRNPEIINNFVKPTAAPESQNGK